MNRFFFNLRHLALCGAVGIAIKIVTLALDNSKLFLSICKAALIGVITGVLIQLSYKVFHRSIKNTMLWTDVIVSINIAVVITACNLIVGNTSISSILIQVSISVLAGILVVFFQYQNYKLANKKLEERKLAQMEQNKQVK